MTYEDDDLTTEEWEDLMNAYGTRKMTPAEWASWPAEDKVIKHDGSRWVFTLDGRPGVRVEMDLTGLSY